MIGMYVLVALISQFASGDYLTAASWKPQEIKAVFSTLEDIQIGCPVTYKGIEVGSVRRLPAGLDDDSRNGHPAILEISPLHHRKLPDTIAAVVTRKPVQGSSQQSRCIEIIPAELEPSASSSVLGCRSFTAYWSGRCKAESSL